MSLSDYKITDAQIAQKGVIAAPDRMIGTAPQNKAVFDRLIRETIKDLYNDLIDALEEHGVEQAVQFVPGEGAIAYIRLNDGTLEVSEDGETWIPVGGGGGGLPPITPADEGKFLRVVNGAAAWAAVPSAEDSEFGGDDE